LSVAVRLDHQFLLLEDLGAKLLGLSLDVLGGNPDAGQVRQQLVAFLEADPRSNDPHHPQHVRRERTISKAQLSIARAEAGCALLAVVVCPAEPHLTQDRGEGFVATAGIARWASASRAWQGDSAVVGAIRVQSSGNRHARYAKRRTTRGYLDGLEIPLLNRGPYEGFDL
jgi:hypothetical protein